MGVLGPLGGGLGAMLAHGMDFYDFKLILDRFLGWPMCPIPKPCYTMEHFVFFYAKKQQKNDVLDSVAGDRREPRGSSKTTVRWSPLGPQVEAQNFTLC